MRAITRKKTTLGYEIRMPVIKKFQNFTYKNRDKPVIALYGGASSGKSVWVAQHMSRLFVEYAKEGIWSLVIRKTRGENKASCFPLMQSILRSWDVPIKANKSDLEIKFRNSIIYFRGLDDPEKFKSIEYNNAWIEEPTEVSYDDFKKVDLRVRRPGPSGVPHQVFLTFNPISSFAWPVTEVVQSNDPDRVSLHSTWRDNPYVEDSYKEKLEKLKTEDYQLYRVYNLGKPGMLKGVVYQNWKQQEQRYWPAHIKDRPPDWYALDFGTSNPMGFLAGWDDFDSKNRDLYVKALLYKTGMVTGDLLEWMDGEMIPGDIPIYADPSRNDSIEEIRRDGYECVGAQNDVLEGIGYVRRRRLILDTEGEENLYLTKEIRNYKFKETKDGTLMEKPVKSNDHLMDCLRYGAYSSRPIETSREDINPNEFTQPFSDIPILYHDSELPGLN